MRIRPILLFSLSPLMMPLLTQAEIILGPMFKDHAILQRDKPLPVWGRGTPGEKLTVTFNGQSLNTTPDKAGRWIVFFEPVPAIAEGVELVVTGNETVVIKDVLVGEVWLASGQSNMEWPVARIREEEKQLAMIDLPL